MNLNEIKKMRFLDLKNIIYDISERGYIINTNENTYSYSTFLQNIDTDVLLNSSASTILLKVNGVRKLGEIFSETFEMYEGVTEADYICDFMDTINLLEHSRIIYSVPEKKRYDRIRKNSRKALHNRLTDLDREN